MTKRSAGSGLGEAKREPHFALHAIIIEAALGRNRRRRQQLQSFGPQLQFTSASRESTIGACDCSRCADASARRDFQIARVNTLLVKRDRCPWVRYKRSVKV